MTNRFLRRILAAICLLCFGPGYAQVKIPELRVCDDCLQDVFYQLFEASNEALPPTAYDSARFQFSIEVASEQKALLYLGDSEYITVMVNQDTLLAGKFIPKKKLEHPFARYLIPVKLKVGFNDFQAYMTQNDGKSFTIRPILMLGSDISEAVPMYYAKNEPARMVNLICVVLISLLFLYSLYQAFFLGNNLYKAYSLYLVSILFFLFLFSDEYLQWHFLLPENLDKYGAFNIIPQGIIYTVYAEFGLALLDIKRNYKFLFRITRVYQVLTVLLTIFHAGYLIFSGGDQEFIFNYFFKVYVLVLVISLFMTLYILFKVKDKLKWFLLIGGSMIGWAVGYEIYEIFVKNSPKPRDFFYTLPSGFMHFSVLEISYVIESLIFLMGINFKNLRKEKENASLKEHLIIQLTEKEKLEKEVNELLQERLRESEKKLEIEQVYTENERNKTKLMQSQLSSLQLQMNPHYLFNSLNSINDFIISKKPQEASEYLALYARMMRGILRNSDKTFNTLEQEIQFCEDYLQLEALRFDGRFDYQIIRPKHLQLLEKHIPGMMLQPILENAVWHGMMPLKRKGSIIFDCGQSTEKEIVIEISDNGNGLDTDKEKSLKESYGLKNIKDKIALIENLYGKNIAFEMKNYPESTGVKVRFVFPDFDQINTDL